MLWLLLLSWVGVVRAGQIVIDNTWGDGFQGHIDLNPSSDLHGWTVHLVFDQPISDLQIWKCEVTSHTSTEWVIHNLEWDADISAGSDFRLDFVGSVSSSAPGSGTFTIDGASSSSSSSGGGGGSGTGSKTTTTRRPTTHKPRVTTTEKLDPNVRYSYKQALKLSTLFYDAQRSGELPAYNRVPWRGDSGLDDGSDVGIDLTGGWYDAGDHVKFGFPMAWAVWVLNLGFLEFDEGYSAAGVKAMMCSSVRWPLNYFLKAWRPDDEELYVQVGDGKADHAYWGRAEDMNMDRPSYKVDATCPGSDVAAKTVSALVSGYIVFQRSCASRTFAETLLTAGKSLYKFAKANRGLYTDCVDAADEFYHSDSDRDELAAAAAWLYKATNDTDYLTDAENFYPNGTAWGFNWNEDSVGAAVLLYELTQKKKYMNDIDAFVQQYSSGQVNMTTCGLSYRDKWGPNRHAANAAFIALLAAKNGIHPKVSKQYAMSQINYLLGDNKQHISFEIGFGDNYPTHPHHRGSSCSAESSTCDIDDLGDNPNLLKGALVGGPDGEDEYTDDRSDYIHNEVAVDYNAGFQGALAGLIYFARHDELPVPPDPKC